MSKNTSRFIPLFIAIAVIFGILIGSFYANHFSGRRLSIINTSSNKINDLFHLIDDQYVDTVNIPDLVEKSMPQILKELDPHSSYISAKDVEASMQDLVGSFSGIGVQFTIFQDTVRIVRILKGGPSENVGLHAGDRILAIDNKPYVGKGVNNEETFRLLKGQEGSEVKVTVKRAGVPRNITYTITRGAVPVKSVDAVYMATPATGYIRIASFGETTYAEFLAALAELNQQRFKNLVIDLRGNLGGYMEPAVQIANEFLEEKQLIVYLEGRKSPRQDYKADGRGAYKHTPVVVLVDENSASASEIFTAAMQDNDRATIVGRRTFGKGLVQIPIEFNDGSMLRLTKARYYAPSGRCLQKPYTPGDEDNYEQELFMRALHGEYYNADSIKTSGEKYKTRLGRVVYGGGGVVPDEFIPQDTSGYTSYAKEAMMTGLIFQYSYAFIDAHREKIATLNTLPEVIDYLESQNVVDKFASFADKNGLQRRNLLIARSSSLLEQTLISNMLSNLYDAGAAAQYLNASDLAMKKALEIVLQGKTFPAAMPKATAFAFRPARQGYYISWQPRAFFLPPWAVQTTLAIQTRRPFRKPIILV